MLHPARPNMPYMLVPALSSTQQSTPNACIAVVASTLRPPLYTVVVLMRILGFGLTHPCQKARYFELACVLQETDLAWDAKHFAHAQHCLGGVLVSVTAELFCMLWLAL